MTTDNKYKYVSGISYQTRWKEVHSEELSLSGAFRAFRGLLASEKDNSAKRLLDFIPSKLEKKEWQQFEKYITKRYDGGAPKKRYSMYYLWQFFDKLAKEYYLENIEKEDLQEDKKARLIAARDYLAASRKEKQDKKAQSK